MEYLSTHQLAARFGLSTRTVERWRADGLGPPHLRLPGGTVRYLAEQVDAWSSAQTAASSSSRGAEPAPEPAAAKVRRVRRVTA